MAKGPESESFGIKLTNVGHASFKDTHVSGFGKALDANGVGKLDAEGSSFEGLSAAERPPWYQRPVGYVALTVLATVLAALIIGIATHHW